jgi:hypothetical protein
MRRADLLLVLAILITVFGVVQGFLGFELMRIGAISVLRYFSMAVAPILVGIALYFSSRRIKSGEEPSDA